MDFTELQGVTAQISLSGHRSRSPKRNNQILFPFTHLEKVRRNSGGSSTDESPPATCKATHVSMPGNVSKHPKYYIIVSFYVHRLIRLYVNDKRETHAHTDIYWPTLCKWPTQLSHHHQTYRLSTKTPCILKARPHYLCSCSCSCSPGLCSWGDSSGFYLYS
jgi:hypothetical protein